MYVRAQASSRLEVQCSLTRPVERHDPRRTHTLCLAPVHSTARKASQYALFARGSGFDHCCEPSRAIIAAPRQWHRSRRSPSVAHAVARPARPTWRPLTPPSTSPLHCTGAARRRIEAIWHSATWDLLSIMTR
eukprot:995548-Pleurochrysis_carterae.AAC.1